MKDYEGCVRVLQNYGSTTSADCFDLLGDGAIGLWMQSSTVPVHRDDEFSAVTQWGEFLRHQGVNIDDFFGADYNALMAAARDSLSDSVPRIALLLALGASLKVADFDGMTAWHHLFSTGSNADWLRSIDVEGKAILMLKQMRIRGQDLLGLKDGFGNTAYDYAVQNMLQNAYNNALKAVGLLSSVLDTEHEPGEWLAWFDEAEISTTTQEGALPAEWKSILPLSDSADVPSNTSMSNARGQPLYSHAQMTTQLTPQRKQKLEARRRQQKLYDIAGLKFVPKAQDPLLDLSHPIVNLGLRWMKRAVMDRFQILWLALTFLGMLLVLLSTYVVTGLKVAGQKAAFATLSFWVQAELFWYMRVTRSQTRSAIIRVSK